jgi:hypothetical protein
MLEIYDILTVLGVTCFSISLVGYLAIKYIKNTLFFEEILTSGILNVINEAQNNEEIQKNLYTLGAILGNGIAGGSGMTNKVKGGGKFNLQNFLAETAASVIAGKLTGSSVTPASVIPTALNNSSMNKDKW